MMGVWSVLLLPFSMAIIFDVSVCVADEGGGVCWCDVDDSCDAISILSDEYSRVTLRTLPQAGSADDSMTTLPPSIFSMDEAFSSFTSISFDCTINFFLMPSSLAVSLLPSVDSSMCGSDVAAADKGDESVV